MGNNGKSEKDKYLDDFIVFLNILFLNPAKLT